MSNREAQLLASSLLSCGERIKSLGYSLAKNRKIFPVNLSNIGSLSEDDKESIDALILRYSQCVSIIQDQIFKGILLVEQEDISGKSNRDKTLLIEKLGAIKSADEFAVAAVLRNKFAHSYPCDSKDQIDKLNTLVNESACVIETFETIVRYISEKSLIKNSDFPAHNQNLPKPNTPGG